MRYFGARITSTLSVMLMLFVVGLIIIGGLIAHNFARAMREQFVVTIELSSEAEDGFGERLAGNLNKLNYVSKASYISADSALLIMEKEIGENPETILGFNPLPSIVEVQLDANYATTDSIQPILKQFEKLGNDNISKVEYNRSFVDLINVNMERMAYIMAGVALVLMLIIMSVVNTTVKLALHAERIKIYTMQMVGASSWYMHSRYTRAGFCIGLIATILAGGLLSGVIYLAMEHGFRQLILDSLFDEIQIAILVGCILFYGLVIPALASWRAVSQYLNRPLEKIYKM